MTQVIRSACPEAQARSRYRAGRPSSRLRNLPFCCTISGNATAAPDARATSSEC